MQMMKKKLVGYELAQEIQAYIQNKVTGKRGTRVTAGGITCNNVACNGDSKQKGVCLQRRQQQQTPPVSSASGMGEISQRAPRYSTITITPMCVISIIGREQLHKIIPSCNIRWKRTWEIDTHNSGSSSIMKVKPALQLSLTETNKSHQY
jgi:hypothetical protein